MKKKRLAMAFAAAAAISVIGCSSAANETSDGQKGSAGTENVQSEGKETDADFSVGFALNSMDEANKVMMTFMENNFKEAGVKLTVADAGGSVDQQITDIENFMTLGVDVVAVKALDSNALKDVCEQAAAQGITVVNYVAGLDGECVNFGYDLYHFDDVKVEWMIDYLEQNPEKELKIGYIWGAKSMEACQKMYQGFNDRLKESSVADRVEIVTETDADWSADNAITAVEDWLQAYPEINCITGMSDTLVCAAAEALRAAGKDFDDYILLGNDGNEDAIEKIRKGEIEGSVYVNQDTLTKAFLQTCEDIRDKKIKMGDDALFTDFVLVTKENVDEYFG